jgi:hypothetical protein
MIAATIQFHALAAGQISETPEDERTEEGGEQPSWS